MSFQSQVITVFISSPSDVADNRQFVLDEMQAWNQRNSRTKGCTLFPITWEDLVAPDMGESGQDIVNLEVGDDYDVFLGLMWARFGTPTSRAESGTQEEFNRALERKSSGDALRISFFFRNSDVPFDSIDSDQIAKIKSFKEEIAEKGAFYRQYADDRELASGLTVLFDKISNEKSRYLGKSLLPTEGKVANSEVDLISEDLMGLNSDLGLFDLEDQITKDSEDLGG